MHFAGSHPIDISTVEMMSLGKVCTANIPKRSHSTVAHGLIPMFYDFDQEVNFGFRTKSRNRRAADVINLDELWDEMASYSPFFREKHGWPLTIIT